MKPTFYLTLPHSFMPVAFSRRSITTVRQWMVVVFHLVCVINLIDAQRPRNFNQNFASRGSGGVPSSDQQTGPDSTVYQYYLLDSPSLVQDIQDSLADIAFLHKYTEWNLREPALHTGNVGSAVMPLLYHMPVYTGFAMGYEQYRPYQIRQDNFRFYKQNRPITDVYFSQLATQENIMAGAAFSRNFKGGLSLSLNYLRISQKGFYNAQKTRSTAFGLGIHYESPSKRYRMFLLFTNNANEESHNGGVVQGANLNEQFKQVIPVTLSSADTRQQERHISVTQYYSLQKEPEKPSSWFLSNHTSYQPSYYKYADKEIDSLDQVFYGGLALDSRGIRRYTSVNQFQNAFYLHGRHRTGIDGRAGITVDLFNISSATPESSYWRTDVTATFDGNVPIARSLLIDTKMRLGLGQNTGNVDIRGNVRLVAGKVGSLLAGARFFRSENPYRTLQLDLNNDNAFTNSYAKPFGTSLSATLVIPRLRSRVGFEQMLIQNPVYFREDGLPVQSENVLSLSRLLASVSFRLGHFGAENTACLQLQSTALYPLPPWFTSHQVYYSGTWFKKVMDVSMGLDGRLLAAYKGPAYQPLFGAYHLSDNDLPMTPILNVFFMARISSFRAKFIMENIGQLLFSDRKFSIENHPFNPPALRFGVQWLLKD